MITPKQLVRLFFYNLGYEIFKRRLPLREGHERIESLYSTYAPWLQDEEFQKVYRSIYTYTMVDQYRLYELWKLVAQTSKLEGDIIEVGVWRGGSGGLMCKRLKMLNISKRVYLADTYNGMPKASSRDDNYDGGEHGNTSVATVERLLSRILCIDHLPLLQPFSGVCSPPLPSSAFGVCTTSTFSPPGPAGWLH